MPNDAPNQKASEIFGLELQLIEIFYIKDTIFPAIRATLQEEFFSKKAPTP